MELQARGLCPHDGRELSLMLAGQKPAAIIIMTPAARSEWGFWIENLTLVVRESPLSVREGRSPEEREMIVALKGEFWRLDAVELLLTKAIRRADMKGVPCSPYDSFLTESEQMQMGEVLGYSKEQIKAWADEHGSFWQEEKTESNVSLNTELVEEKGRFGKFLNGIIEDPMAPSAIRLFSAALAVAKEAASMKSSKKKG